MRLHAVCYYRSRSEAWTDKWRDEDYAAMNLVKAVKGLSFGGSSIITQNGGRHTVADDPAGRATALRIAAMAIAGKIRSAGYEAATLIPVPSSSHVKPGEPFTGLALVDAIHKIHPPYAPAACLHFDQVMPKARGGGTRNPHAIQAHFRVTGPQPEGRVVLIDDVCTSGGHLIAAARFLRQQGVGVDDAFVIGRTRWDRPESMWKVETEHLADEPVFFP